MLLIEEIVKNDSIKHFSDLFREKNIDFCSDKIIRELYSKHGVMKVFYILHFIFHEIKDVLEQKIQIPNRDIENFILQKFDQLCRFYSEKHDSFYHQQQLFETLQGLSMIRGAIRWADPYTFGHQIQVGADALAWGKVIYPNDKQLLADLEIGGYHHDIGKIIMTQVLKKPGALTRYEEKLKKEHPIYSEMILREYAKGLSEHILLGVRTHHEWFDGQGYPQGLSGKDIPLIGRVLCILDSYDAMTSDRVYQKRIPEDEAVKEIKKFAGTQFDPYLADKFIYWHGKGLFPRIEVPGIRTYH